MIFNEYINYNDESYIVETFIGDKIREVINHYNWKRKAKKYDADALSENIIPYKRKETHSKSDMDRFYKNNDYIIECVSGDEHLCQMLANILGSRYNVNTPIEIYVTTGRDMNKIYDLSGNNAYQDDIHHVIIPTSALKNTKDIVSAKYALKARYFNDVVDNNEYREYLAGRHKESEQIKWLVDYHNESYIIESDDKFSKICYSILNGSLRRICREYYKNEKVYFSPNIIEKSESELYVMYSVSNFIRNQETYYDTFKYTNDIAHDLKYDKHASRYISDVVGDRNEGVIHVYLKPSAIKESYKQKGNNMNNKVLVFSGNNGGSYIHDALYESYIQAKIDAEDRLAFALKESMVISEADYSNIRVLQEAKLSDKIKAKWIKFVAFIKNMAAKFMESMTNILLDEKGYLEKYKDIILKKTPKEDLEFSYTGNYENGIKRIINTEVPLFDYQTYKDELEDESNEPLVRKFANDINWDGASSLAEMFKDYFLDLSDGQKTGKFSSLNFTNMYNFCYNFNKIKGVVDKDLNKLETSTRNIETAINKAISDAAAGTSTGTGGTSGEGANTDQQGNNDNKPKTTPVQASFRFSGRYSYIKEDDASDRSDAQNKQAAQEELDQAKKATADAQQKANDAAEAQKTGLKINKSTDASSKMGSVQDGDEKQLGNKGAEAAKAENKKAEEISKAADKWIVVCRALISAKLTACQQISKDYMAIIREHVRSYGGQDKNDKEGNRAPQTGDKYEKNRVEDAAKKNDKNVADANKALEDAKKKEEEANKKLQQFNNTGT